MSWHARVERVDEGTKIGGAMGRGMRRAKRVGGAGGGARRVQERTKNIAQKDVELETSQLPSG